MRVSTPSTTSKNQEKSYFVPARVLSKTPKASERRKKKRKKKKKRKEKKEED